MAAPASLASVPVPSLPEWSEDMRNGGNPKEVNVNLQYTGLEFQYVYQVIMGMLVMLIIPGIGMLYGGMARRKSALAMIFQSMTVLAVCTFQWMFWGFSLAFSRTGGSFIGDLSNFGMKHVMVAPSWGSAVVPDIVFCFYELMFCACATMIVVGGSFERGRIVPSMIFGFLWATICYCPIAYWTWNANGWLYKLPGLDFAGGGPVHISSGTAGLAYALVLGKRRSYHEKHIYKPHNVTVVFLGTTLMSESRLSTPHRKRIQRAIGSLSPCIIRFRVFCPFKQLIWFGWFGFNGGSALNASMRSMVAVWNTNCAACMGVLGWTLFSYFKHGRKFSVIGACEGAIAGLVGITPAVGYVSPWFAALIGFLTAIIVSCFENVNEWLRIDDGLEVFKLHGIGGMCGAFLTGIFATEWVSALDGIPTLAPGAIDGNGIQVAKQIAEIAAIAGWSFSCSCIMLLAMKYIPGLHLRVQDDIEEIGMDMDQFHDEVIGEWALFEQEDHHRRRSTVHGVPVASPLTPDTRSMEKVDEEGVKPAS